MALAIHASTPAVKANNGGSPTSNSVVSPPANGLFVVFFTNPIDNKSITSISGGGMTWANIAGAKVAEGASAEAEVWYAFGSPSTFTATLTMSGTLTTLSGGYMVSLIVWTGAASTQNGHVKTATSIGGLPSATLTAAASTSWVMGVVADGNTSTSPTPAGSQTNTFNGQSMVISDSVDTFAGWVQGNPAAGNGNLTINDTAPTCVFAEVVVEILAGSASTPPRKVTVVNQAIARAATR